MRRLVAATAAMLLFAASGVSAQITTWPSEAPPRPLAARDVQFPPYELRTLPNGMQLIVIMHHEEPLVSLRLIVRAGSVQDPAGKAGVASLAAALLDQGTTTRTAGQIADAIDSVGGDGDTGAGRDLSYARIMVMKDSFDLAATLLADEVRNPTFAPAEIERQRSQILSALEVSYDDPEYLANIVFDRLVYGPQAYGSPTNGTPESIARITREDLQAFHDRWFVPNNCLLAVVGDVAADEAFATVTRAFGDWPKRGVQAARNGDPPSPVGRVVIVDKPDLVQTEVRVGHLGIPRKQNDYLPMDLAVRILGGEGANRLHRVLRMERGLTYGASAEMETLKWAGEVVAITNTRSEATGEVLRLIVDQFNRLRTDRVDTQELADAKAYLTGNFPLRIETPDDIAMQVLNVLFYDLPVQELQTYRQRVNAVTVDDIARVANTYLHPDRLTVVLVGNAKAFVNQLRGVGFDKYEVIPAGEIDLTAADLRRRAPAGEGGRMRPARLSLTMDQQDSAAQAILQRAIDAKGGAARLEAMKTVVFTSRMTVTLPKPVTAQTTNYIAYPDRFRVDAKLPNGDVTQVLAGADAWMADPGGVRDLAPAEREALRSNASHDLVSLLLGAAEGRLRVRVLPAEGGQATGNVDTLEFAGDALSPVDLLIDRTTGMITAERYLVQQPGAIGQVPTEEWYSDYRPVDGVQVAFKTVVRRGQAVILDRTLTDLKINVPIDAALFKRPM